MDPNRRLTRSTTDRMIGGVCGGLANYLNVDSTLVRIIFVLLVVSGLSPFLYLVLWVIVPSDTMSSGDWSKQVQQTFGEIQERATTAAHEVSNQVHRLSSAHQSTQPPTDQTSNGPATGKTTRL